jgi:hypothetical protein
MAQIRTENFAAASHQHVRRQYYYFVSGRAGVPTGRMFAQIFMGFCSYNEQMQELFPAVRFFGVLQYFFSVYC